MLRQHPDLTLSNEAFDRFMAELEKPPAPVDELIALFKSHPRLPKE